LGIQLLIAAPMKATAWLALAGVSIWAAPADTAQLSTGQILARIAAAQEAQEKALRQYSATRWYTIRFDRNGRTARMMVQVDYRWGAGKRFEILAANDADGILGHVLRRIVEGEADARRDASDDPTRLTPDNYDVQLLGAQPMNGRRCYLLGLKAKRRSKYLINGRIWVDAADFGIVRLAGRLSASLSFWVGKPWIDQSFRKVDGFWLASTNHSITDAMLFGRTELTVESGDYRVPAADTRVARRSAAGFAGQDAPLVQE
jgi:hypothetical protein